MWTKISFIIPRWILIGKVGNKKLINILFLLYFMNEVISVITSKNFHANITFTRKGPKKLDISNFRNISFFFFLGLFFTI